MKVTIFLEVVLAKVCANSRAPIQFRRESLSISQDSLLIQVSLLLILKIFYTLF